MQTFPQICGKPCSLILWFHAVPITHSEASIHLDIDVISKTREKMKTFFPSFHEVIEIISEVYTCVGSKDVMTLQRIFRTLQKISGPWFAYISNTTVKQLRNIYVRWTWAKDFSFIQFRFTASRTTTASTETSDTESSSKRLGTSSHLVQREQSNCPWERLKCNSQLCTTAFYKE